MAETFRIINVYYLMHLSRLVIATSRQDSTTERGNLRIKTGYAIHGINGVREDADPVKLGSSVGKSSNRGKGDNIEAK